MKINGVEITHDSILKARQYYIDLTERCAAEVKNGSIRVNNVADYLTFQASEAAKFETGAYDYSLGFAQRAYYIQTGKDVAILA